MPAILVIFFRISSVSRDIVVASIPAFKDVCSTIIVVFKICSSNFAFLIFSSIASISSFNVFFSVSFSVTLILFFVFCNFSSSSTKSSLSASNFSVLIFSFKSSK